MTDSDKSQEGKVKLTKDHKYLQLGIEVGLGIACAIARDWAVKCFIDTNGDGADQARKIYWQLEKRRQHEEEKARNMKVKL